MERFYCDVLGFEVAWRPDEENVYLTSGTDNLALHAGAVAAKRSRVDHFGLMVPKPEDVDAWHRFVLARGAEVRAGPRDHRDGTRSLYLSDPEGNVVQLMHVPSRG